MTIVLALFGLSVSTPGQVSVRVDAGGAIATATHRGSFDERRRVPPRAARHETVRERVWVDGYYERVWRPAEFGLRYDSCGNRVRFVVRAAGYDRVWVPGRWEYRTRRVPVRSPFRIPHRRYPRR